MKALKVIAIGIIPFIFIFSTSYFYLVYKNNIEITPPSEHEIKQALNNSINWVLENQDELIQNNNPALWWFLDESAFLTNNNDLSRLVRKYRTTVLDSRSVWTGYWVKKPPFTYLPESLNHMAKYQKFFIYALSCDSELGKEKVIQDQLDISFCDWHPYYSSCITHQMMAIRLLQTKHCGDQNLNTELSDKLIDMIESQLVWDPRVGDVYIQRALMLVESGNSDKMKPIWLRRILDEQRDYGAWANFYQLFPITKETEFGFGYKIPEFRSPARSSLHTTAQAIYLLSLISSVSQ